MPLESPDQEDQGQEQALAETSPGRTLDYFIKARNGNKRDYIQDYKKSKTCPHNTLTALAIGGTWYRCRDCNYAFDIVAAYQQPLHNLVIGGFLNALSFAKEFGGDALGEVLRRPIGQSDGTGHKPVLPEGMSFTDAISLLESVDVNAEDGGVEALKALLEEVWVGDDQKRLLATRGTKKGLDAGKDSSNIASGKPKAKRKARSKEA
jgi:hypothetical protein